MFPQLTFGAIAVLLVAVGIQTVRARITRMDADTWEAQFKSQLVELDRASAESYRKGLEAGQEAVLIAEKKDEEDKPAVLAVRERIRNVCVRPKGADSQGGVPLPAVASSANQADAAAQDDNEAAGFANDLADDIEACNGALNQCTAIQQFVKENS